VQYSHKGAVEELKIDYLGSCERKIATEGEDGRWCQPQGRNQQAHVVSSFHVRALYILYTL
jgi:hypothetical protein